MPEACREGNSLAERFLEGMVLKVALELSARK